MIFIAFWTQVKQPVCLFFLAAKISWCSKKADSVCVRMFVVFILRFNWLGIWGCLPQHWQVSSCVSVYMCDAMWLWRADQACNMKFAVELSSRQDVACEPHIHNVADWLFPVSFINKKSGLTVLQLRRALHDWPFSSCQPVSYYLLAFCQIKLKCTL